MELNKSGGDIMGLKFNSSRDHVADSNHRWTRKIVPTNQNNIDHAHFLNSPSTMAGCANINVSVCFRWIAGFPIKIAITCTNIISFESAIQCLVNTWYTLLQTAAVHITTGLTVGSRIVESRSRQLLQHSLHEKGCWNEKLLKQRTSKKSIVIIPAVAL